MTKNYHELIENCIFIGGADDVQAVLEQEQVDIIVDLRAEASGAQTNEYNRVHIPIVDHANQQEDSIKNAINFVVTSYREGNKVYFHCGGGSNRTGTVAIGTLLALGEAETIEHAEAKVKAIRSKINVKSDMKEALAKIFPKA